MPRNGRPNILLLHVDEQPWNALAGEGNTGIRTPNIDRLAKQGCRFSYCFTQHLDPVLARSALLAGQYPSRVSSGSALSAEPTLLPRVLRSYGYRCAGFGSMRLTEAARDWRKPYPDFGFDQLEVSDDFGRDDSYNAFLRWRHSEGPERVAAAMAQDPRQGNKFFQLPPDATPNALVESRTLSFLQQQAKTGQPFFCLAGLRAFSWPLVMPQRFLALYDAEKLPLPDIAHYLEEYLGMTPEHIRFQQRAYYASVTEVDDHVGLMVQELERLSLSQNTLVVFTAGRGRYADTALEQSGTWIPDVMARVPLIVRGPAELVHPDIRCNSMAEAIDVAPTLLKLAGICPPPEMQGVSLAPVLAGQSRIHRDSAMTELPDRRAIRTRYFQYVVRADGVESLFDLSEPEKQFTDVAEVLRYRGALAEHRHHLIKRMIQAGAPVSDR